MKKITKAIIPIAGKGTRFLPITKCISKEIIPIIDMPMVYYVVKEAVEAGIEEILFITSYGKNEVLDFFDSNLELENFLREKNDLEKLKKIQEISSLIKIHSVRQKETKGLAHAIYQGKSFINENESFCVLLADDLMINNQNPVIGQLIQESEKNNNHSVIGVFEIDPNDSYKYGVIKPKKAKNDKSLLIEEMVEKPEPSVAPSNLASPGRYVFYFDIFKYIENIDVGKNNEYQLTDAINMMCKHQEVYAKILDGDRYDTGTPLGYLNATIGLGLSHPVYGADFREIINKHMSL